MGCFSNDGSKMDNGDFLTRVHMQVTLSKRLLDAKNQSVRSDVHMHALLLSPSHVGLLPLTFRPYCVEANCVAAFV